MNHEGTKEIQGYFLDYQPGEGGEVISTGDADTQVRARFGTEFK